MFSYDGSKRPTIEELKTHPWLHKPYSTKITRQNILEKLMEKRSQKTADTSRETDTNRAGINSELNQLIRQQSLESLRLYRFDDMADHDIDVDPAVLWEDLNMFNVDFFNEKLIIDANLEKKHITIQMNNESNEIDFLVKAKLFNLSHVNHEDTETEGSEVDEDAPKRLRLRFTKKRGDLQKWYEVFNQMKETVLEDILLAPVIHHTEILLAE
jgi:hypothetical protein